MKKTYSLIIIFSFIFFLINLLVFFNTFSFVLEGNDPKSYFMLYLSIVIIVISLPVSYYGYHNIRGEKIVNKVLINIIFWTHLVLFGIFLVLVWQGFRGGL